MNQKTTFWAFLLPIFLFNQSIVINSLSSDYNYIHLAYQDTLKVAASLNKDESAAEAVQSFTELQPNLLAEKRDSLVNFAKKFLGTPYWWGGTTPKGFDCSGFAQYIFKNFGFDLPRVSGAQAQLGKAVKMEEAQAGDLVYYGYPYGNTWVYTHTAIVYANDSKGIRVIHCYFAGVGITGIYFDPNWRVVCIKRMI